MLDLFKNPSEQAITTLIRVFIIFTALPLHEFAHALLASHLGDPTAKNMGRLSLNPFRHLDPFGTLMLLLVGIGFAKPVPVNPNYFKNPRKGMALTAAAGPLSNLLFAYLLMVLYKILFYFVPMSPQASSLLQSVFGIGIAINILLAIFNLLPIPPLDGSRVLDLVFTDRMSQTWHQFEHRYGNLLIGGIMLAMFMGLLRGPMRVLQNAVWSLLLFLTGYIDFVAVRLFGL